MSINADEISLGRAHPSGELLPCEQPTCYHSVHAFRNLTTQHQTPSQVLILVARHAKLGDPVELETHVPPQLQLRREALVRLRDWPGVPDDLHRLVSRLAPLVHEVGRGDGHRARHAGMTVDEDAVSSLCRLWVWLAVVIVMIAGDQGPGLLVRAVIIVGMVGLEEIRGGTGRL